VAALPIVEDLQVLEHRVGQLDTTEPIDGTRPESLARWVNAQEANCTPWSEWTIAPVGGMRLSMAMPRALVPSAVVNERIRQMEMLLRFVARQVPGGAEPEA
jgi:hypothetical protein